MNPIKIKKAFLDKIKQIIKYNQNYYEKSDPLVSDLEYDNLKKKYLL